MAEPSWAGFVICERGCESFPFIGLHAAGRRKADLAMNYAAMEREREREICVGRAGISGLGAHGPA